METLVEARASFLADSEAPNPMPLVRKGKALVSPRGAGPADTAPTRRSRTAVSHGSRAQPPELPLDVFLERHPSGQRPVQVALCVCGNAFLRSVRVGIGNERRDRAVFGASDPDAFPESRVRLLI